MPCMFDSFNSSDNEKSQKSPEPFSTVAADEIPDVPNNSFLFRRSRTPSPVREKRITEGKERLAILITGTTFYFFEVTCRLSLVLSHERRSPRNSSQRAMWAHERSTRGPRGFPDSLQTSRSASRRMLSGYSLFALLLSRVTRSSGSFRTLLTRSSTCLRNSNDGACTLGCISNR